MVTLFVPHWVFVLGVDLQGLGTQGTIAGYKTEYFVRIVDLQTFNKSVNNMFMLMNIDQLGDIYAHICLWGN